MSSLTSRAARHLFHRCVILTLSMIVVPCAQAGQDIPSITVVTEDNLSGTLKSEPGALKSEPTPLGSETAALINPAAEIVCITVRRAGYACHIDVMPWARALKLAQSTPNVIIAPIARSPDREAFFVWGGVELIVRHGIFGLKGHNLPPIKTVDDLKRLRIGTIRGDFRDSYLRSLGLADGDPGLQPSNDVETLLKKLEAGRIDGITINDSTAPMLCKRIPLYCEFVQIYPLSNLKTEIYFAFDKETDSEIIERIMHAWRSVTSDGTYAHEFEGFPGMVRY